MIVSWNWLKQYVKLDMPLAELEQRLMMAGLNHESTEEIGGDLAIDLEVTSNRPDCLGHLGIAREVAALWKRHIALPPSEPDATGPDAEQLTSVEVDCPEVCPRYTARVIRGVQVGPSPAWLKQRLATVGIASINNVVDITNYVLMECGQPLHAFDLDKLRGGRIVVRRPRGEEQLEAIDHRTYQLAPEMCIIADAEGPVAIGGIMGGAATEVTETTVNLLIESAQFDPSTVRDAARALNLHSDSSYRFERGVDPEGVDWASRRCCQLILEIAGGELAAGSVDIGKEPEAREPVSLRFDQLPRVLGIEIPRLDAEQILTRLGCHVRSSDARSVTVIPPSWRRDLTREIDLVEEVGRIHGYDAIPEDVRVPMAPSSRTQQDRVLEKVRRVMTSCGLDECLTLSAVDHATGEAFSPWTTAPALRSSLPILRGADQLRRSLIPSLLTVRRTNEAVGNERIELFEIARVYLPRREGLPQEEIMLGLSVSADLLTTKGILESLLTALNPDLAWQTTPQEWSLIENGRGAQLSLQGDVCAVLGEVSAAGRKQFGLRGPTTVAELRIAALIENAQLVPQYLPLPEQPAMTRDLNLEVPENVTWAQLEEQIRGSGGELLESLEYLETYRDAERLGPDRKSILLRILLRAPDRTLTGAEADQVRDNVQATCAAELDARLRTV